jgi:hypothetical protein
MHGFIIGPYLVLIATLMRALAVRAKVAAALCARCGLRLERSELGERVCTCNR